MNRILKQLFVIGASSLLWAGCTTTTDEVTGWEYKTVSVYDRNKEAERGWILDKVINDPEADTTYRLKRFDLPRPPKLLPPISR